MAIKEYLQRVFPGPAEEFCQKAGEALAAGRRLFVVTANPEILMHAGDSPEIRALLLDEEEIRCAGTEELRALARRYAIR